ncbi:MAG TPA: phosphoribosylamine--glycine ligase [Nitratifractor sp.]|nr:phosphoribosylamine--glycine ligase [Nitratifractor sp.]HHD74643.1 phosphoribosylamine--glycine ligase [Nitratifractor sp.]HHH20885.1 phosphoribosylamine--glycine ligase [Nitratifractor sp.]
MDVLIIGSGGREYSIGYALKKDENVDKIYFAPGNGATDTLGKNIALSDFNELANFAKESSIELTIVGPEDPLVNGIVDVFHEHNLNIFGPSKAAAQLEGSKVFMKNCLQKYGVPTAKYLETDSLDEASSFINTMSTPIVVKADGLCAGKGVIIAPTHADAIEAAKNMLSGESFGDAGSKIIVEEYLDGYELSIFAVCDGKDYVVLPAAQDHKRVLDGDEGPNTGGMGAYAPTPLIDDELYKKVEDRVIKPTLEGLKKDGMPFTGVLFIGVMVVNGEPIVLEYNVRFGDPECEELMVLIESPVSELFYKAATGDLANLDIKLSNRYAVGVVLASQNYPYSSSQPAEIIVDEIVHKELSENSYIAYAGVSKDEDGTLLATGGRVLVCVGIGESIQEARDRAYMLVGQVHFIGKKCRTDIAYQALAQ